MRLLERKPGGEICLTRNLLDRVHWLTPHASLLYLLAEKNVPSLISREIKRVPHMDIRGESFKFSLIVAVVNRNEEAIRAPLTLNHDVSLNMEPDSHLDVSLAKIMQPLADKYDFISNTQTPLTWAMANGKETIARLLFQCCRPYVHDEEFMGLVQQAANWGREGIIRLLLETGEFHTKPIGYWTSVCASAIQGRHETIAKLLLEICTIDSNKDEFWMSVVEEVIRSGYKRCLD